MSGEREERLTESNAGPRSRGTNHGNLGSWLVRTPIDSGSPLGDAGKFIGEEDTGTGATSVVPACSGAFLIIHWIRHQGGESPRAKEYLVSPMLRLLVLSFALPLGRFLLFRLLLGA